MQKVILGDTKMRDKMLKTVLEKNILPSTLVKYTEAMRGKSEEEKERIAEEILKKIEAGEIS